MSEPTSEKQNKPNEPVRDDARCDDRLNPDVQCVLEVKHHGLHFWKSQDGAKRFEWG
jgi:hypothetical protein